MQKTPKKKLKLAVINIITCFILAWVVEGIIFTSLENPSLIPRFLLGTFRDYYTTSDRRIIQVTDCAHYDSTLFYLLKPGPCIFENREFAVTNIINGKGCRDDEKSLDHPEMIALGDSYTMGWGVNQDETFPQLLERSLNIKVLNAGISSFGTAREFLLLQRLPLDSVRYILVQYHANDYGENKTFLDNKLRLKVQSKKSYDSLRTAITGREKYYPFKHLYGLSKALGRQLLKRSTVRVRHDIREAQSFLDIIQQAHLSSQIRIIAFKLDDHNKLNNGFATAVDSLLQGPQYENLNLQTLKLDQYLNEDDYFRLDDHINKRGHGKIAAKIREQIISHSP